MERKNYDAKVISVFDTVGSFFVDVFYNSHYLFARDLVKSGRANSITDAYRGTIINYMSGIAQRPDLYMSVVKKLHEFYQKVSGFGAILFSEFEDKVLSQFIPLEYYRDFTERHKDNTLHEIIVKTVNQFSEVVIEHGIFKKIIDDHLNSTNVTILQDKIVDIFIIQREDYYAKFAQEISKSNGTDKVSKQVVEKLKSAFVDEKKKRCEAEADRDRAVNMISQLVKKIEQLTSEIAKQNKNYENYEHRVQPVVNVEKAPTKNNLFNDLKSDSAKYTNNSLRDNLYPVMDNIDNTDESDDESDEETAYRRQREQIAARMRNRKQVETEYVPKIEQISKTSISLDDDPGFG
ncbi:Hypothetical protein PACV_191 [Pacmanvirus A23]|uniref:Hypothetical protein n=1 Tax=Pacmanvirus A23 TaxID=1932881 RepID=UPI000A092C2C|nr:Hypothetical protein B9W72_gp189 [Pacmanvirus A23]SIP85906.1 Hypothetical protein PACV_191 [Pacmanvirus A23]